MSGAVCNFLGSVSLQQNFEVMDAPVLQPHVISSDRPGLQLSFIGKQKKIHPRGMSEGRPRDRREDKLPAQFWLLFIYVFSPAPEPALCKL